LRQLAKVMSSVGGIRRFGAASLDLAFVAAGRCDGYFESHLSPWDMAAGIVIVREAGGLVTDYDDRDHMLENGVIIAGNSTIHKGLLQIVKPSA
jgi:myo-inositol-1(or 4)-monophosphatase